MLAGAAFTFFRLPPGQTPSIADWHQYIAAALLWLTGAYLASLPRHDPRPKAPPFWTVPFLLILALALFFQFYRFWQVPLSVWYDEMTSAIKARDMLQNPAYRPIYIGGSNTTALHLWLYALLLELFGQTSVHAMRLLSVFFGLGSVVLAYMLGRQWRGQTLGLLMAFFIATMRWVLHFSHWAMTTIDLVFFLLLNLYLLTAYLRRPDSRRALYLAIGLGLGLWFYQAFRVSLLAFALPVLFYGLYWRKAGRALAHWGLMALTILILVMPILSFAHTDPQLFWIRTRNTSVFTEDLAYPRLSDRLVRNFQAYTQMFHFEGRGDPYPLNNRPYAPALDPMTGVLFVLGLGLMLLEWRRPENHLMLLVALTSFATGMLATTIGAPHSGRTIGFAVVAAYAGALVITRLLELARPYQLYLMPLVLALCGAVGALNFYAYYEDYARDYTSFLFFAAWEEQFLEEAQTRQEGGYTLWAPAGMTASETMAFLAPALMPQIRQLPEDQIVPLTVPAQDAQALFLLPTQGAIYEQLLAAYPGARGYEVYTDDPHIRKRPPDLRLGFYVVELTPAAQAAVQGLDERGRGLIYLPRYGDYRFLLGEGGSLSINGQAIRPGEPVTLPKGLQRVQAHNLLAWQLPGQSRLEPIPPYHFYRAPMRRWGLWGDYFPNATWEGEPALQQITPPPYTYYHIAPLEKPYSVIWRGTLRPPQAGEYRFIIRAAAYVALYLDGEPFFISDPEGAAKIVRWEGLLNLEQAAYAFEIRFADSLPLSEFYIDWIPPGQYHPRPLPVEVFTPPLRSESSE
jgi:4-amino-4-deoxy-L-arabinose transferase-like glycosyltransferase